MTEQVVVALAALAAAAWIARPLLQRRRAIEPPQQDRHTADLLETKQAIYRSILDLELDHEMGKMDEHSYLQMRRQSKAEALDILRELRGEDEAESAESTLEDEIRAARARLRKR